VLLPERPSDLALLALPFLVFPQRLHGNLGENHVELQPVPASCLQQRSGFAEMPSS
jgi:hypothetical protein